MISLSPGNPAHLANETEPLVIANSKCIFTAYQGGQVIATAWTAPELFIDSYSPPLGAMTQYTSPTVDGCAMLVHATPDVFRNMECYTPV